MTTLCTTCERGPAGPRGPVGGSGGSGSDATALTYKTAAGTAVAAPVDETSTTVATARCDPGQRVVSGGVKLEDPLDTAVYDAYPDASNTAWTVHIGNDDQEPHTFTVYAICIR